VRFQRLDVCSAAARVIGVRFTKGKYLTMKIHKCAVSHGNEIWECDMIIRKHKFYLVPEWLQNLSEGWQTPKFAIRIEKSKLQNHSSGTFDYVLSKPLPKGVFDGTERHPEYSVLEAPNFRYPLPKGKIGNNAGLH